MAKGFGIAGLVLGILAIFVPVVSLFIIWLALVLVTLSAMFGDRIFSVATLTISIVNVLFLSPITIIALVGEQIGTERTGGSSVLLVGSLIVFAGPIIGLILNATGRVAFGSSSEPRGE